MPDITELARDAGANLLGICPDLAGPAAESDADREWRVAQFVEQLDIQSWQQVWGSTTGPFDGYGGSAMTSMRTTVVSLSHWGVWYLDTARLCVTDLRHPVAKAASDGSRMPGYTELLAAVPAWALDSAVRR